jgi:16S rRNA (cytidine1402-2'-O)-methyltransferase
LAEWATGDVRGEIVVVIAGASASDAAAEVDDATLAAAVAVLVEGGLSRRDAVDQVAAEHGVPRRRVYSAAT